MLGADISFEESGLRQVSGDAYFMREFEAQTGVGNEICRLYSMLSAFELAMCFRLARDFVNPGEAIIDLGALSGAETNAFARGLAKNPGLSSHPGKTIFAYDLFTFDMLGPVYEQVLKGKTPLEAFYQVNDGFRDVISVRKGDILNERWLEQQPVAVVFNDISKSIDLNQHVLKHFIRYLRHGGILIQQDFFNFYEYWTVLTMYQLRHRFDYLEAVQGGSCVFRLSSPLAPDDFEIPMDGLSVPAIADAYQWIRDLIPEDAHPLLAISEAHALLQAGDSARARQCVKGGEQPSSGIWELMRQGGHSIVSEWIDRAG